jgi:putative DNA primase/helicase
MQNNIHEFRNAMREAGLTPPDALEPGTLHRFPGIDKGKGNEAGWCRMFADGLGGVYGDWSNDINASWQAARSAPFTPAEREALNRQIAEARASAEAERKQRQSEAAAKAVSIWQAATLAPSDHAYLVRKGIKPHGAKLHNGALVIAVREGADIHSLQFIAEDGAKRFLKDGRVASGYFSIGTTKGAAALCIAEGFATGATIHELTGYPVAVAFNAGNLEAVAIALRAKLPAMPIIVCADDDLTAGNPGRTKATAAALAIGAKLALPDFWETRPEGATDFNDLATHCGAEAVKRAIEAATIPVRESYQAPSVMASNDDIEAWPEPQPMLTKVFAEKYPLDALPETIRAAVVEVHGFTKAPLPMVASSALAALSLATQSHVDMKRAAKLIGPAGLFLLTIADSGERKSTCDGFFTQAIREYEITESEKAKPAMKDFFAALSAWEAKHGGVREKIRQLAKDSKSTNEQEERLRDLENSKPSAPRIPRLLYADATPEALAFGLGKQWPSGGVVSAEAGIVFGSHGMGKDSVMRNLAMLNQLWDGNSLTIDRRSTESFTVRGARLTVALQVQEPTLREFFLRSGALARGTGFLARFLVAWPESTQGSRPFTEAPADWPQLAAFNKRIAAILQQAAPIDVEGALSPHQLSFTNEAKSAWVEFHNEIESQLSNGGELYDVRDVASKSADNAARLAALFQTFEHGADGTVGLEAFDGASRIAAWHLNEARRFFGELALPTEMADSARLDTWLIDYCRRERTHVVGKNHTRQHGPLRNGQALDGALCELSDLDRLRLVKEGKRLNIRVNPTLIAEGRTT